MLPIHFELTTCKHFLVKVSKTRCKSRSNAWPRAIAISKKPFWASIVIVSCGDIKTPDTCKACDLLPRLMLACVKRYRRSTSRRSITLTSFCMARADSTSTMPYSRGSNGTSWPNLRLGDVGWDYNNIIRYALMAYTILHTIFFCLIKIQANFGSTNLSALMVANKLRAYSKSLIYL